MPDALSIRPSACDPEVAALIAACERRELSTWEREFVASIRGRWKPLTEKQLATLTRIAGGAPNYNAINAAALRRLGDLLDRWLPGGKVNGVEFTVLNPRRGDRHTGNFKVNLATGKWADFATGEGGRDPVALAAYLFGLQQPEAARRVAEMLGLPSEGSRA